MGKRTWTFYAGFSAGIMLLLFGLLVLLVNPRVAQSRGFEAGLLLQILALATWSIFSTLQNRAAKEIKDLEQHLAKELEVDDWKEGHPSLGYLYDNLLSVLKQREQQAGNVALWQSIALSVFMFILGIYVTFFIANLAK